MIQYRKSSERSVFAIYTNTAYMNLSDNELENYEIPLRVNCCGVYRLISLPSMSTYRAAGRSDYQILYVASGNAVFTLESGEIKVPAGSMVLYTPHQTQKYIYYLEDKPEVYWIHFTGNEVKELLQRVGFIDSPVLYTGISSRYQELFSNMIREIQLPRPCSEELSALYLKELFYLIQRQIAEGSQNKRSIHREMEKAVSYFHENFTRSIQIETYAEEHHMSTCWFIRSFKQYVGMPPGQYLTSIRISKAKELLESTGYSVSEIGSIVGYENPLYFSRIFKKQTGSSPTEYQKGLKG